MTFKAGLTYLNDLCNFEYFYLQSLDKNLEHDVYDEYLTQAEIQGNVNKINSKKQIINMNFLKFLSTYAKLYTKNWKSNV